MHLVEVLHTGIEPITIKEATDWLQVSESGDNPLIGSMITTARKHLEKSWGISLSTKTYKWYLDDFHFKNDIMELPVWPVQSVTVQYYDADNTLQTFSDYNTDFFNNPARLENISGWPSVYDKINAVVITIVSGFDKVITVDATDNEIDLTSHGFSNGMEVKFKSTNILPTPIGHQKYYVVSASTNAFGIANRPSGSAIDITDTGTGIHYLDLTPEDIKKEVQMLVYSLYDNRGLPAEKIMTGHFIGAYNVEKFG